MFARLRAAAWASAVIAIAPPAHAQLPTITDYTKSFEKADGSFPLYWAGAKGRLLVEIPAGGLGEDFLFLPSLATGLGDVRAGLARGTIGDEKLARFERVGPRVELVLQNPQFRATTDNEALARSVRESFATSTIAAFEVLAEEGGRVLIDGAPLALSDVSDVRGALRGEGQGSYQLDRDRSAIYLPRTKGFPENTEIEASLTFTTDQPGRRARQHAPDARAITLRQHLSLVKLPGPGFRPRRFAPRLAFSPVPFYDFARPFARDYVPRYAIRPRLAKRNPGAGPSDPVKPIVYYLDPGVPEPYRAAFKEGAAWWNRVFEAAGFKNAFRVDDMPPDMDPMDARYSVIQWIHRTEAGYSIGPSFVDPRTGEIIKAAVRMESHRSLTDYDIYAGTLPTTLDPDVDDAWLASLDPGVSPEAFAMARRRQHAAHEVGHTLGLAHNFIASSYGRASVMAYPAPLIKLANGQIDLSDAYRDGPGAYDTLAIRYDYTEFPPDREEAGLEGIAAEGVARGLRFITNPDEGGANSYPEATTWVNGADAVAELGLVVPEAVLRLLAPTPFGYDRDERAFQSRAAPAFDQLGIARTLATQVVGGILTPERAARLAAFADRNPQAPTLTEVIERIIERTWGAAAPRDHAALQRVSQRVVVDELIRLARDSSATVEARAGAEWGLRRGGRVVRAPARGGAGTQAHRALAAADIERFLDRRDATTRRTEPLEWPPGAPIGKP